MRDIAASDGESGVARRLADTLRRRESLLRAISDVAGQMLELGSWDGIEHALHRLGESIGVQRASLLKNRTDSDGRLLMSLNSEWADPGVEPQMGKPHWQDMHWPDIGLSEWQRRLGAGEPVAVSLGDLPPEGRYQLERQGILSVAAVPIFVRDEWWGSLVFDDCLTERDWPDAELNALQAVAKVFASFIMRVRNERSLRASEARYRDIVMALPDFIFRLDSSFRFMDVQTVFPGKLHIPREEFIGRTISEVAPPEIAAGGEELCRATIESGQIQISIFEMEVHGRLRTFETRLVPSADQGLLAILRDVTEAREAERRLRESEARFRSIVQAHPDIIFRIDDQMRFTEVQTAHPEDLLVPPDQIPGRTAAEILPPEVAALAEQQYRAAKASGGVEILEYTLDVRGEGRRYESRLVPCTNSEMLAIVREVTEAREAERRLRESEARYNAVVNDQTELICRFGADSVLTFVNDAYCRYFGRTAEELLGNRFMPMIPEEDQDLVTWMFSSLNPSQPLLVYEHRVYDAAGDIRWVEWTDRLIMDESGMFLEYQSVGRDVTERKELQRRLLSSAENEQKRLAQELHDGLCQDLKGLEIEAALLEDRLVDGDPVIRGRAAEVGRLANLAVRSAYDMIRGMLPVGLDAAGFGPALSTLVERAREQAGCRIELSLCEGLLPVSEIQANNLFRIAQEALGNALRHSKSENVWLSWGLDGEAAVLSVRDDGIGFDAARPRWENEGVGLTILESRSQSIRGRLRIESQPGRGTEVRCLVNEWSLSDRQGE